MSRRDDPPAKPGQRTGTGRRQLLQSVLTGGALAAFAGDAPLLAQESVLPQTVPPAPGAGAREFAALDERPDPFVSNPGSDVMVDVIKSLGIQYIAANPGSSFRGLHESIINYGRNEAPELLTCLHEETSVAIATGYARATGKPMAVVMHATVGVQHGAMSIYNAFVDCMPVLMFAGASLDAATRRPNLEWLHAAQDNAATVRDFTKWDDQPISLQHFAESTVRGVKIATDLPMGPVLIMVDQDLQERPFKPEGRFAIPRQSAVSPPVGDGGAIETLAEALVGAKSPVILAHRYARTDAAMPRLIALAELIQAPVVDSGERNNFPTDHPLNHSQRMRPLVARADVVLALEPVDLWGAVNRLVDQNGRPWAPATKPGTRIYTIGIGDHATRANYQNFQRYVGATLAIEGDAEATLPLLIEAVKRRMTPTLRGTIATRGDDLKSSFDAARKRSREEARFGWDASPVTTARLCLEIWDAIKGEDWVLASHGNSVSGWPQRLWDINKPHQYCGSLGAAAVGSNIGLATGVALAYRGSKRIIVNIQGDGDLLYAPGALWTAAHHKIPILNVVHNNRAYHQEVMHVQRMADRRERGIDRANIGTAIDDPPVNFAKLADSMGMWSAGPILAPADLRGVLRRAVAVVKSGAPALIEVVTQPR